MDSNVYRVSGKRVTLNNGEKANVAMFAYKKADFDDDIFESIAEKFHLTTGCTYSDSSAKNGHRLEWVVVGEKVLKFPNPVGSFTYGHAVKNYREKDVKIA